MNARKDVSGAKEHFKEGFKHLKMGVGCAIRVVKAVPAVIREKQEGRREKNEAKKRERAEEKKKKWEEKVKKADGEGETEGDEEPTSAVV